MTDPLEPGDEAFLSRWSRRKRAPAEAEPEPSPAERPVTTPVSPPTAGDEPGPGPSAVERARNLIARLAGRTGAAGEAPLPAIDLTALPSIESLTAESDIADFLRKGVPLVLRNAALRRIWTLDPVIRDFIGPVDYGWDFNAPGGVPGFSLDLDGADVEWLLAQATGRLDQAADAAGEAGEPPASPAGQPIAAPAPGPAAVPVAASQAVIPVDAAVPDATGPARPPRRRHGGALPA